MVLPFRADTVKTSVFGYKFEYEEIKKQNYLTVTLDDYFVKYNKEIYAFIEFLEDCDLKVKYQQQMSKGVLFLR